MTRTQLLRSILDIEVYVGDVRLRLEDIIDKSTTRGIENDIEKFEIETMDNTVRIEE